MERKNMDNKNYGRLSRSHENPGVFEYAPRSFKEGSSIIVPKIDDDEAYFSRGWLKVIDVKPPCDYNTQILKLTGYDEDQEHHQIIFLYTVEDIPDSQRTKRKIYSKLKLTMFCMDCGLWNIVKAKLEELGYYDLFVMAQYFTNDDKNFIKGIDIFKEFLKDKVEDVDKLIIQALTFAFDREEIIEKNEAS